jgi:hypothetical protein
MYPARGLAGALDEEDVGRVREAVDLRLVPLRGRVDEDERRVGLSGDIGHEHVVHGRPAEENKIDAA